MVPYCRIIVIEYCLRRPSAPAAYAYSWAVKDDYTANNYGQEEKRDGYATSGSYYVLMADGRVQKVNSFLFGRFFLYIGTFLKMSSIDLDY